MTLAVERVSAAADVHTRLARHLLVDGFDLVLDLERSHGSWLVDARNGTEYLEAMIAAFKLRAGKSGYVALYAYDRTGNVSAPARRTVSLAALIPLRPLTGSSVTTAPRMTWKAQEGIAYYNVQVYRNGRRILVGWQSKASFQLPAYLLTRGIYTWYVWPAFKHANAATTFGTLIGRATFTYVR